MKKKAFLLFFTLLALSLYGWMNPKTPDISQAQSTKLYWFIPDGLRADPYQFNIFKWAQEGKLPNIKYLMENGSYGFSIPVFPGHTPSNFASLFTGVFPKDHGITDGPLRLHGYPLRIVSKSGFSSTSKLLNPIWYTLEQNNISSTLLSVPGSTPPEIEEGNIIKGRWGNWGINFPAIIFHSKKDTLFRKQLSINDRVFNLGKKLTQFIESRAPHNWEASIPKSFSPPIEINMRNWGKDLFAVMTDNTDDEVENYDSLHLSFDKKKFFSSLKTGDWSPWFDIQLNYEIRRVHQEGHPQKPDWELQATSLEIPSAIKVKVIRLGKKDEFRIRLLYSGLNRTLSIPQKLSEDLTSSAGPMVDFVDNYPPQLIYYPEDKETFLQESKMSFQWHQRGLKYLLTHKPKNVFIHNIYSPNQMLTSRWWMGALDKKSKKYHTYSPERRKELQKEVLEMYQNVDSMLGEALQNLPKDAHIVFSSDHGAAPLNKEVRLNNLFARKGWLKFYKDSKTQHLKVDWKKTRVVFLKMNHIYINPKGLDGNYYPSSGDQYEELRNEVIETLNSLENENGISPLDKVLKRSKAHLLALSPKRVGDLVISNKVGFNWVEDMSEDLQVFHTTLKSGYKQAINPEKNPELWTPFIVYGPKIKKNYRIPQPISHLHQYPTVMKILETSPPHKIEKSFLSEVFQ